MSVFYGVDDGHDSIKCINGNQVLVPSKVMSGKKLMLDSVTGEQKNSLYTINGNDFTISQDSLNSASNIFLDTRIEKFPMSDLNIVLVHHALKESNAIGDVVISTGLPFNRYYKNSVVNKELIDAKKKAFKVNIEFENKKFKIVDHHVCSEAVAAYYDIVLNDDGTDNKTVKDMIGNENVVIVDIGGRTTDIVTINNGAIDFERSCTLDMGGLIVKDKVKSSIETTMNVYNTPDNLIKNIIENKEAFEKYKNKFGLDGKIIDNAKLALSNDIQYTINKTISNTIDVAFIAFVGGGSILLENEFKSMFNKEIVKFVKNPVFANARGMKKIARRFLNDK